MRYRNFTLSFMFVVLVGACVDQHAAPPDAAPETGVVACVGSGVPANTSCTLACEHHFDGPHVGGGPGSTCAAHDASGAVHHCVSPYINPDASLGAGCCVPYGLTQQDPTTGSIDSSTLMSWWPCDGGAL